MSDVIVIGDNLQSKTTKSGKQVFHIKVESEPLIFNLDTHTLVKPVAEALAHHLRERMKGIAATASTATIKAREAARRALLKGEQWATKRYSGGRMGTRIPAQSDRLFNDSGRFAESIVAAPAKDGTFRVNVAANRLSPDTLNGGTEAVARIWQRLVQLVPAFGNLSIAMQSDEVLRARVKSAQGIVKKVSAGAVAREVLAMARGAVELVETAAGG